jgi:hypothetical protein
MDEIKLDDKKIRIFEDTILYFQNSIELFDILNLKVNVSSNETKYFQILYNYSFDKINYTDFVVKSEFVNPDNTLPSVYISIFFKKNPVNDLQKVLTLNQEKNIDERINHIDIENITYSNIEIDLFSESVTKFQTLYELINQFPKWNFYDNQQTSINRWLKQCNSIAEMYGHTCIYFKTEPIESETIHTFKNHVFRNVVAIKKLHILSPGNELPHDRNIYSDWDMPLQDDFILHVVVDKFEQAFGINKIPIEKDYLYLPIINKLFRISATQPKNGYMGKIGWWEVYLSKFEDDETIVINPELKTSMESTSLFNEELSSMNIFDDSLSSEIFSELQSFKEDTVVDKNKIDLITVEEKKKSTQNFTNKLVDSTHYISLKETEILREFYNNHLKLVSINPDTSAFPITMYDNTTVEKRVVAMQYSLTDYSIKNKFNLQITNKFTFSFNYVLLNNFTGEIFDFLNGNSVLFTIQSSRNKFEIIDNRTATQNIISIAFGFKVNEIYNIILEYIIDLKQFSIKIFSLNNQEKTLEYQNIYINNESSLDPFTITGIQLFGGNFYSNEIIYKNNTNIILRDYTNPLLIMKNI